MGYSIYVDGSAPGNQNGCTRGGIGLAVYDDNNELIYENGITVDRPTDNAELELMALVEALEYAEDGDVIYSDSEYCVKGFNEWLITRRCFGFATAWLTAKRGVQFRKLTLSNQHNFDTSRRKFIIKFYQTGYTIKFAFYSVRGGNLFYP